MSGRGEESESKERVKEGIEEGTRHPAGLEIYAQLAACRSKRSRNRAGFVSFMDGVDG